MEDPEFRSAFEQATREIAQTFTFDIPGKAAPKGSRVAGVTKTGVRFNRESNPHVPIWMKHAKAVLSEQAVDHTLFPKDTPLRLEVTFYVQRPKKPTYSYPPQGDLDKYVRAVSDALTGICWTDDSQVVSISARKAYDETARTVGHVIPA